MTSTRWNGVVLQLMACPPLEIARAVLRSDGFNSHAHHGLVACFVRACLDAGADLRRPVILRGQLPRGRALVRG